LRGRWNALQQAQEKICRLLEVTYPLAAEAYRDETNLVFVVPDLQDLKSATLSYQGTTTTLEDLIKNAFAGELQGELEPKVWLGERSRGAINLGQTLREEFSSPQPKPDEMRRWWNGATDEICTVCRVRPQGFGSGDAQKARSRNVCSVCLERREKRSRDWADNLSEATIWIDEAADRNGRVALIAGKFDLTGWLDGKYLGSIAGRKLPGDAGFSTTDYSTIISSLSTRDLAQANLNSTTCLRAMQQNTNIPNLPPASIYEVLVTERDQDGIAPNPASADYDQAARHLFRGFFGKNTSFARLRRIWETTGEFWEHARAALGDPEIVGKQKYRIILQGQFDRSIGPSHVYDVRAGKVETSFVYDGQQLISADNLRYLAKQLNPELPDKAEEKAIAESVCQKLQEFKQLELYEKPSRQGRPVKVAALSQFTAKPEEHNYSPVIPLLAEPQIFIALVPAEKAMKVIAHLRDEYEKRMSKVRNRLPLHLNLLTFNRRIPLYVAMDAVRRMLDRKTNSAAQWRVAEATNFDDSAGKLGKHAMRIKLSPAHGNRWAMQQISAGVSYNLGDDSKDFYYPYFFVAQANEDKARAGKPLTERPHHWQAIHPTHKPAAAHRFTDLIHVSELCKDDILLYSPSTFDFEHLDVAGRRFELNYGAQSGIRIAPANRLHPATRPLLLEEIADLETVWSALQKLPSGQRDFLVRLIETKRTEWKVDTANDATLRRFACDTLQQAGNGWWKNLDDEQRHLLEEWAANGKLADALELYEKMMKIETV
jgi:CRISPR-associated Csx11 family protein